MRPSLFILLLLSGMYAFSQPQWIWTSPVDVAEGKGNLRPRIALNGDNLPVVIWGNGMENSLYLSTRHSSGFNVTNILNPSGMDIFVADWAGPELAAAGDSIFVIMKSLPVEDGKIYIKRSVDGGYSFGDTVRVQNQVKGFTRFPNISIAPGGHPVVNYMIANSTWSHHEYAITQSIDGGNSFAQEIIVTDSIWGEACDCCPAFNATDGKRQVLLFRNNDQNIRDTWAAASYDGGTTFTRFANIDSNFWNINICPSTGPDALFAGDSLVAVFRNGADGTNRVFLSVTDFKTISGGYRKALNKISGGYSMQNNPRIAGNADTMGVVWEERRIGKMMILFTTSVTGAAGLGKRIDTLAISSGAVNNPDIAFANSHFHVVYEDNDNHTVKYITTDQSMGKDYNGPMGIFQPLIWCHDEILNIHIKENHLPASLQVIDLQGRVVFHDHISGTSTKFPINQSGQILFVEIIARNGIKKIKKIIVP